MGFGEFVVVAGIGEMWYNVGSSGSYVLFNLEGDYMHIVTILVILLILLAAVVTVLKDEFLSMLCAIVILMLVSVLFVIFIIPPSENQVIALERTEETYTLINQGTEEAPCYAVADGDVVYFTYRGTENEMQSGEADVDDVSNYYQSDERTLVMERINKTYRPVWLFIKGFEEETVEYHYTFYVPEGSIVHTTCASPKKPG